ncbi:MAG: hypothetical protein ACREQ7_14100 [Candidatus Binatia bacterium]
MLTVAGIFTSKEEAELAREQLQSVGFAEKDLILLAPGASQKDVDAVPTEDAEQPGMGKAIGSVVGGAVGLAGGAAISNLILPGVGPVIAIGLGAGALGVGGAVAGGATGGALENLLTRGLPKDEIFLYEDALRQCRTVLIAAAEDQQQVDRGHHIMEQNGAESLDAAREKWWIGLRDAEETQYAAPDEISKNNEQIYRCGFEAALEPEFRGVSIDQAANSLRERYPNFCDQESFRRGYERGQSYFSNLDASAESRTEQKANRVRDYQR